LIDIPLTFECPPDFAGYLPPRISLETVGAVATIADLRAMPDYRGSIIGVVAPDAFINRVIAGPLCSSGFVWWLVDIEGLIGWTPESNAINEAYWIESLGDALIVPPDDEVLIVPPDDEVLIVPPDDEVLIVPPDVEAPAIVEVPVTDPDLRIDYSKFGITIVAVSNNAVNPSLLSFSSSSGSFNGSEWRVSNLTRGDCVQLYYFGQERPEIPNDCTSVDSWISRGTPSILFWQSEFTVSLNGLEVGACRAAPNNGVDMISCDVALQ
jgi:hypothetical protein